MRNSVVRFHLGLAKDTFFIQQIISEEIESGASRAYMDGLTFTHFRLFETWKRKKILEIVCEKIEVEYL